MSYSYYLYVFSGLVWVILGAGIWMVLESDWKFADSIYFCFITISTIGFGDLVPEVDLSSGEGHLKLVVIITYITVGTLTDHFLCRIFLFSCCCSKNLWNSFSYQGLSVKLFER